MGTDKEKDQEMIKALSVVLKEIRKSRSISQQMVYEETGIHVGRIELGSLNVSVTTLSRLCRFYHVNMIDLFARLQKLLNEKKEAEKALKKKSRSAESVS
jgi:transcriptional regulator with XRE-family HTH domain